LTSVTCLAVSDHLAQGQETNQNRAELVSPQNMPTRYTDYLAFLKSMHEQHIADMRFAREAGVFETSPFGEIAYIGVNEKGERIKLERIASLWREKESVIWVQDVQYTVHGPRVVRIPLARISDGVTIRGPYGQSPVQADGFIEDSEFYFRSRGTYWSVSIGGDDVVANPEWYHEDYYAGWPSAGRISDEEARSFILKAAHLYRSGQPTMQKSKPTYSREEKEE